MLAFVLCLLCADPSAIVSPKAFCESAYILRQERIADAQSALDAAAKANDFTKLSKQARDKIEKPLKKRLTDVIEDRELPVRTIWPTDAKVGDVFAVIPGTPKGVNAWAIDRDIDDATVLAAGLLQVKGEPRQQDLLVIQGLLAKEIPQPMKGGKSRKPIELNGLWHRVSDVRFNGTERPCITRWPHEAEAKRLWAQMLVEQERYSVD